jgi:uncharacterized protein
MHHQCHSVLSLHLMQFLRARPCEPADGRSQWRGSGTSDSRRSDRIFGVETTDKILDHSKSLNDERINRIIAVAKKLKVDPKYVSTDLLVFEPWYRRGSEYPQSLEVQCKKDARDRVEDTKKFQTFVAHALEGGATHIHGVQFRPTEMRKHRDTARTLAIKAAREKAATLADGLGQKIGKAYRISEHSALYSSDG